MHAGKDKPHKHQCMTSFQQRRKTWTSGKTRSTGKCRILKMKQSCDLEMESVTEGRPEYCRIESRSESVRGLNDEIMNEMMITKFNGNHPSNTVKRTVSAASTLDCRYRRNNNMITDEKAVSLSDVSCLSDQPMMLNETRNAAAVNLSIKNLTINNSSGVDIGCVVNKSFSNDSKPIQVDVDITAMNCNQAALTYSNEATREQAPVKHHPVLVNSIRAIIVDPSGLGKTQLLLNLIMWWLKWDELYLVAPSVDDQRCYDVLKEFNESTAAEHDVIEFITKIDEAPSVEDLNENINNLVVYDDVMLDKQANPFRIFSRSRHKNTDVIYVTQRYTKIPKVIRDNCNLLVIFNGVDTHTLRNIHTTWCPGDMDIEVSSRKEYANDPYLQNVIDNTQLELKSFKMKLFEKTPAFDLALNTLRRYGTVFIIGKLGDGKTLTSRKLMKEVERTNTILLELHVNDPASFDKLVNGKRDTVVFIDDFLGKKHLDPCLLKLWTKLFPKMEEIVREGNVQFILTTRKDILEEVKHNLQGLEFFCEERIVDMSTSDLSGIKERILTRHIETSTIFVLAEEVHRYSARDLSERIKISAADIREISSIETVIGFPYSCYLFTRETRWALEGMKFFRNPVLYLKSEIELLKSVHTERYSVLALILLCGGTISYHDVSKDISREPFKSALSRVSKAFGVPLDRSAVARDAEVLATSGTFLTRVDDGSYVFSHQAIEEAVSLTYRTTELIDIIELCPFRFLLEMVVINSCDPPRVIYSRERRDKNCKIELSIHDFEGLANRFMNEIFAGNVWEVVHHTAFLDLKFLDCFFQKVTDSGNLSDIIHARHNNNHGGDLLFYAADNEKPRLKLVEKLLEIYSEVQSGKKNQTGGKLNCFSVPREKDEEIEKAKSSALYTACRLGRKDVVDVLLRFGTRPNYNLLSTAMHSHNVEIVQTLLQSYKWTEEQKRLALQEACRLGSIELFGLMVTNVKVKKTDLFFSKCLVESAKSGNVELFKKILDKGCDVNYRGEFDRCALHEACIRAHGSLVTYLTEVPDIDTNVKDMQGYTALHYAAECNFLDIAKLLISAREDVDLCVRTNDQCRSHKKNPKSTNGKQALMKQGMTPYDLACLGDHDEMCKLLEEVASARQNIDLLQMSGSQIIPLRRM